MRVSSKWSWKLCDKISYNWHLCLKTYGKLLWHMLVRWLLISPVYLPLSMGWVAIRASYSLQSCHHNAFFGFSFLVWVSFGLLRPHQYHPLIDQKYEYTTQLCNNEGRTEKLILEIGIPRRAHIRTPLWICSMELCAVRKSRWKSVLPLSISLKQTHKS